MEDGSLTLDKFYVYRSLHSDESWGAVLMGGSLASKLPNIDFGMRVFARNEKEAIAKAKANYDRIHFYDSDKKNISRFAASALGSFAHKHGATAAAQKALEYGIKLNEVYTRHFKKIEEGNEDE